MAYPVEMQKQLRDLYVLHYLSLEEAAKELGISFATARAWKAKAQQTVDNAQMRYFIVHLHRLLDPEGVTLKAD